MSQKLRASSVNSTAKINEKKQVKRRRKNYLAIIYKFIIKRRQGKSPK